MRNWLPLFVSTVVAGSVIYWFASSWDEDDLYTSTKRAAPFYELLDLTKSELQTAAFRDVSHSIPESVERIVVIPDIHGDSENFIRSIWIGLTHVDGIDIELDVLQNMFFDAVNHGRFPETRLSTPRTTLVQMGDLVDRGPDSVECLRILWSVEAVIGWTVISLYGNHELMSAFGNRREYIHEKELTWSRFGSMERRYRSFRTGEPIGDMLQARSVSMARVSSAGNRGTLFVHAGVDPNFMEDNMNFSSTDIDSVGELNERIAAAIRDKNAKSLLELALSEQSTVWTRILAELPDSILCNQVLPHILLALKVDRIVVGHTPQEDHRMKVRCGRVYFTDIAISSWMYDDAGQPGILFFNNTEAAPGETSNDWSNIDAVYMDIASKKVFTEPLYEAVVPRVKLLEGGETATFQVLSGIFRSLDDNHIVLDVSLEGGNRGVLDLEKGKEGWERYSQLQKTINRIPFKMPESVGMIIDYGLIELFGHEFSFALLNVGHTGSLKMLRPETGAEPPLSPKDKGAIAGAVDSLQWYGVAFSTKNLGQLLTHFARDSVTDKLHLVSYRSVDIHPERETARAVREETDRVLRSLFRKDDKVAYSDGATQNDAESIGKAELFAEEDWELVDKSVSVKAPNV